MRSHRFAHKVLTGGLLCLLTRFRRRNSSAGGLLGLLARLPLAYKILAEVCCAFWVRASSWRSPQSPAKSSPEVCCAVGSAHRRGAPPNPGKVLTGEFCARWFSAWRGAPRSPRNPLRRRCAIVAWASFSPATSDPEGFCGGRRRPVSCTPKVRRSCSGHLAGGGDQCDPFFHRFPFCSGPGPDRFAGPRCLKAAKSIIPLAGILTLSAVMEAPSTSTHSR